MIFRILMVSDGGCVHARRPYQWLRDAEHQILFLDFGGENNKSQFVNYQPYPRFRGKHLVERFVGEPRAQKLYSYFLELRLQRIIRKYKPHIVHVHWIAEAAYSLARLGTKPLALTAWGSDINKLDESEERSLHRFRTALRQSSVIFADAQDVIDKCVRIAGSKLHTVLLPIGIQTSSFGKDLTSERAKWRQRLSISAETIVFLSVRAWARNYDHESILRAFAIVSNRTKRPLCLVFKLYCHSGIPLDLSYRREIENLAAGLGMANNVRWLNEVQPDQLPEIYALADAIVNFPDQDAFPVSFLEAAAARKPVVSCKLPAYHWPFADKNFFFSVTRSTGDLATAFESLIENIGTESMQERIQNANLEVISKFDESCTLELLQSEYAKLVSPDRFRQKQKSACPA